MGITGFQSGFLCGLGTVAVFVYPVHELYKMYMKPRLLGLQISSSTLFDRFMDRLRGSVAISCICTKSLKDKVVVITSVSDITGYYLAYHCIKSGARVIVGCDDYTRCNDVGETLRRIASCTTTTVTVKLLDLNNYDSCSDFAEDVLKEESTIDFLVVTTVESGRQVDRLWERGHLNPVWKTNYYGCVIVIEKLRRNFTGPGDKGVLLVSSEDLSNFKFSNLNLISVVSKRRSHRELDYKSTKYALWVFCIYLVNGVADMNRISFTMIHPNGVCKTGLDRNGSSNAISCKITIKTPREFTCTILHCMKNTIIQNKCMIKNSELLKYTTANFVFRSLVRMLNNLICDHLRQ